MMTKARRLVEALTRNWVFRRRLPSDFGSAPFLVSPSAGLKYLLRPMSAIDPTLLRLAHFLVKPDDVVWDVGANIGLFSLAASTRCGVGGQVFAFEPDSWLVYLLNRSSAIQPQKNANIMVVPAAIASEVALRKFFIARRSRASNALKGYGRSQMGGIAQKQFVVSLSLDWLLTQLPKPNVLKIDVEGAEVEVLQKQRRILEEVRPLIICEVGEENNDQLSHIFNSANYVIYDGERLPTAHQLERTVWNTVALPEEMSKNVLKMLGR